MAFEDGYFPGVQSSFVLGLWDSFSEDEYGFDVAVCCRVVEEGVERGIYLVKSAPVFDEFD